MNTLQCALVMEQSVTQMLSDLKAQLANDVAAVRQDGVTTLSSKCVLVNISRLDKNILCPSYYIQSSQADAVERKLNTARTATEFVNRLQAMIDERLVKVGNDTIRLNPKTVEVLKSYLNSL